MRQTSIQRRLIAAVLLSQLLLAAGLVLAGVLYTRRRLLTALDAGVQSRAMSVAALVRYSEDASGNVYFDNTLMPGPLDHHHPDLFAVWAERSGLVARSANWPATLDGNPVGQKKRWQFIAAGVSYRALRIAQLPVLDREEGAKFHPQTVTIFYAAPMLALDHELSEAAIFITLASVGLLGITVLLAYAGIRRGLLPLEHLAGQAALVSVQDWELRVPADAQQMDELRPLAESMTQMLARLQRSFVQQKEFAGNAAHELKTPLAVLKSTLQSLLQRPREAEEYREGLQRALEDMERLERLLQGLLRLARAEQGESQTGPRILPEVDLAASCEEAIGRVRPLAEARNTTIQLSTNGCVQVQADPDDLQVIWGNLLENAVRYSPEGGVVEVAVAHNRRETAQVTVVDHGPGIPAADLPRIFDRFYRGDPSRTRATGGFGLGLAIARALVEANGGTIVAESAAGRGTRVTVKLPAKETPDELNS